MGYFSKEKCCQDNYNLACILTLPAYQRKVGTNSGAGRHAACTHGAQPQQHSALHSPVLYHSMKRPLYHSLGDPGRVSAFSIPCSGK